MNEKAAEESAGAGSGNPSNDPSNDPVGLRCDFCGKSVPRVRRVALDGDYERLQTPHPVRYACPECSEAKERSRHGGSA